jgi:hypothetical protein
MAALTMKVLAKAHLEGAQVVLGPHSHRLVEILGPANLKWRVRIPHARRLIESRGGAT